MVTGLLILAFLCTHQIHAQDLSEPQAFGHPGVVHSWSSAKKEHVGTHHSRDSLLWFSSANGILTETYYPTIDKAQIKDSQLLVSDGINLFVEDKGLDYKIVHHSASDVRIRKSHQDFSFERQFFSFEHRPVLIERIDLDVNRDGLSFYLLVNPSLNGTGANDTAWIEGDTLLATEANQTLRVNVDVGMSKASVGFVGYSDGYQDLHQDKQLDFSFQKAEQGNVALTAKIAIPAKKGRYQFHVIYRFDAEAVDIGQFEGENSKYHQSWKQYLDALKRPQMNDAEAELFDRSMVVLRTHEDKTNQGAFIASMSKPWGESSFEDPDYVSGGYHLIWPRDLYHIATALMLAGDNAAATRALAFLKTVQYTAGEWDYGSRKIARKGAFPQNTWTDRRDYWSGLQLDQTAYPIHLFYRLWRDHPQQDAFLEEYRDMVRSALDFIVQHGPWSAQERWEENYGISPSSFAAAGSALLMGHKIFGDAIYHDTIQQWLTKPGDNIHTWTFTESGTYGDGRYFLRVAGCDDFIGNWNPNADVLCDLANSYHKHNQKTFLDQGFLQLSLLGLVPASDERLLTSLEKVNSHIRVQTPKGFGWYRYAKDAYGEDGKGRLWPLLSSEHARFAIEKSHKGVWSKKQGRDFVDEVLASYLGFANSGLMLPEQVFEASGEGTGAATPLAWSHAEYLKTLWSKHLDWNVENFSKDFP